jgi:hypothetical protein
MREHQSRQEWLRLVAVAFAAALLAASMTTVNNAVAAKPLHFATTVRTAQIDVPNNVAFTTSWCEPGQRVVGGVVLPRLPQRPQVP